jgi:hypothetical protein
MRAREQLDLVVAMGPQMGEADDSVAFACHERVVSRVTALVVKAGDDIGWR